MASSKVFELKVSPLDDIEIGVSGVREIIQNIKTICTTWRGSVPLDRDFGIDSSILDSPSNTIIAQMSIDVIEQIRKYEPRVDVVDISFKESDVLNGEVVPLLTLRMKQ